MNAEAKVQTKKKFGRKKEFDVEFEDRTPLWERIKSRFFTMTFVKELIWAIFRYVLLVGIAYVIGSCGIRSRRIKGIGNRSFVIF